MSDLVRKVRVVLDFVEKISTLMDADVITMFCSRERKCYKPLFTRSKLISSSLRPIFICFCEV